MLVCSNTYDMLNIISIKCLLVSVCQEKLLNLKELKANFHTYFDPRYISKYVPALQSSQVSKIFQWRMPSDLPCKLRATPFDFKSHGKIYFGKN